MTSKKFMLVVAVLLCVGCTTQTPIKNSLPELILESPAQTRVSVQIEIADTDESRENGLMFRTNLGENSGMLFVFEDSSIRYFWMKNTLIPLDGLFFDESGMWVSTVSMQPCVSDPCTSYGSISPAKYALEVPLGWAEKNGVGPGWKLVTK